MTSFSLLLSCCRHYILIIIVIKIEMRNVCESVECAKFVSNFMIKLLPGTWGWSKYRAVLSHQIIPFYPCEISSGTGAHPTIHFSQVVMAWQCKNYNIWMIINFSINASLNEKIVIIVWVNSALRILCHFISCVVCVTIVSCLFFYCRE